MRIFASADTFIESSRSSLRLGRLVANATFLEALLRHGPYDRFEFFCPTADQGRRLREWIAALPDGRNLVGRIATRPQLELPEAMSGAAWEVVHSGGWSRYMPALAWLRANRANRPFPLTGTIHSLNDPAMAGMLRRLAGAPTGTCDAVLCTSRDGRESFRRQLEMVGGGFGGRLELAPLGVDERYFVRRDKGQARRRLAIPRDARVALWIGRLSAASKADLHPLLYQWRGLVSESVGERLLVLAGGGSEGDLVSLRATVDELGIGERVVIRPDIEDDEKLDLLAAADVFVSPVDNQQETFGIAVVEAMASGLPVVASRWDGYKDLVEDGATGILVPVRWAPPPPDALALRAVLEPDLSQLVASQGVAVDPGCLRAAVARCLDEPELARTFGEAGRERALRLFSWKAVVDRLAGIWQDLRREADGMEVPGKGMGADPQVLDPAEAFGHYAEPAPCVDPGLRLSHLGEAILRGELPMPPTFGDLMPISDGKLLSALVVNLRAGQRKLSDHARLCAVLAGRSREEAVWLAHWLLKYGVLETAD